jgi:hypothetical protein
VICVLLKEIQFSISDVVQALKGLRVSVLQDEYQLQEAIAKQLTSAGIQFFKEHRIGPRMRLDFFIPGGIVIEVKCGLTKPNQTRLLNQLSKYSKVVSTTGFVVVVDRNVHMPPEVNGKPCVVLGLHKLWGIAL